MVCEYVNTLYSASQPYCMCSCQDWKGRSTTCLSNMSSVSRCPTKPSHVRKTPTCIHAITHTVHTYTHMNIHKHRLQCSISAQGSAPSLRIIIKIHHFHMQGSRAERDSMANLCVSNIRQYVDDSVENCTGSLYMCSILYIPTYV